MNLEIQYRFFLFFLMVLWWWCCKKSKNKNFYRKIPGPTVIPIIGNALDFGSTTELLNTMIKYTKTYGELVQVQIGPQRKFLLISNYDFLECVLSSTKLITKSYDYNFLRPWLGDGLLTSDGIKWKKHRKILTPAFHFQILEQFINVFESCGDLLTEKLKKETEKRSINIYPFITLCSLDIICESIMGTTINAQDDENSDYVQSVKDICKIAIERSMSPIQMYDLLFALSKNYRTSDKALKILHQQSYDVISKRIRERENEREEDLKSKKPFLDLLLEATVDGRSLTLEEIREEVDTFMFEGHDTTASAISFTLFCLANHSEIQKRAFEEQLGIFGGTKNPNMTYADLQNMKYLEKVIKESLRLYPSVPFYGRKVCETVEYNENILPHGDTLVIFVYGIHRNPKYFPDPEKFNPERFDNLDGKFPYAYIPFSAGPRNCIGQKFAMLEMKSVISKVIRKFELQPASPQHIMKLAAEAVLKSANGINISLKMRN